MQTSSIDRLRNVLTGTYAIDRELGRGGMATVYLAHDLKHDRDVAIKVLHPDLRAALGSESSLARLERRLQLREEYVSRREELRALSYVLGRKERVSAGRHGDARSHQSAAGGAGSGIRPTAGVCV